MPYDRRRLLNNINGKRRIDMKIEKYYTSFIQVPLELLKDKDLTVPQKLIMSFIWSITAHRDNNKATILSKALEEITGLDRSNVYRNTKALEEMGYISKAMVQTENSAYKTTEYTLNLKYLLSKYGGQGMKVKLNTDEEMPKNTEKTLDKSTPRSYTYKSEDERRADSIRLAEKRKQDLNNYPYRKKEL